jgi:putative serine protease PepD
MQLPESRTVTTSTRLLVAIAVGIAVVAGLLGGLIARATTHVGKQALATGAPCQSIGIANDVLPAVVTLSARGATSSGTGTGEVIRKDGYILTNDHVISTAANGGSVEVLFNSGQSEPARIVGRSTQLDLAVLKVTVDKDLPTIVLGDAEALQVGQPVVALGAPLGLDGTVTAGIVSALGRDVPVPTDTGQTVLPSSIQTDASINPGNSGGPLVDCAGHLVGVNTAIATVPNGSGEAGGGSVGIGFAIPVNVASTVADQLIESGRFTPSFLGMTTSPIPPAVADRFGVEDGLFVQTVTPNGPAAAAGLKPQDVIVKVDGKEATGPDTLTLLTLTKRAGDKVTIEYVRDGQKGTATVTLSSRAPNS